MKTTGGSTENSAADLARTFDLAFAAPERRAPGLKVALIAIRIGAEILAVRAAEVSGVVRLPRVVPAPTAVPSFLGLAAVRGILYPVYDLALLMGIAPAHDPTSALLIARPTPVALAFEEFEGQTEVESSGLCEASGDKRHYCAIAQLAGGRRGVVDIPGIVAEIGVVVAAE